MGSFQVGGTTVSGIVLARVARYFIGSFVLAVFLAWATRDFLLSHPDLAVLLTSAYVVLCVVGAYFQIKSGQKFE